MTATLPMPKSIIHECPDCRNRCTCEFGFYEPNACLHCIIATDEFRSLHAAVSRIRDSRDKLNKSRMEPES